MTISRDFDFLAGTWDVEHHRLARLRRHQMVPRGRPSAAARPRPTDYLDGGVSLDETTFPSSGVSGMSVRVFVQERDEWEIRWISSGDGLVGPPVTGRFEDGPDGPYCRLVGDEIPRDGRPTRMTYEWDRITPESARWQQAYSFDDEQTWEKNWEMRFTRTAAEPAAVAAGPHRQDDVRLRLPHRHLAGAAPQAAVAADRLHGLGRVRVLLRGAHAPQRPGERGRGSAAGHRRVDVPRDDPPDVRRRGGRVAVALVRLEVRCSGTRRPCAGGSSTGWGSSWPRTEHAGIPILCRFRWTVYSPEKAGWEQAFSTDDGATWEVNWEMVETRVA